jgi:hypothetical protein
LRRSRAAWPANATLAAIGLQQTHKFGVEVEAWPEAVRRVSIPNPCRHGLIRCKGSNNGFVVAMTIPGCPQCHRHCCCCHHHRCRCCCHCRRHHHRCRHRRHRGRLVGTIQRIITTIMEEQRRCCPLEHLYIALSSFWYNKKSWGNYLLYVGYYPPKGENQLIWKL